MPSSNLIKLALVGFGKIAHKHLEVFRSLGCEFVASCNRSELGRRKASEEGGIHNTYAHIDEMMRVEKPDGVISCASVDQIYSTVIELLPFGIPLLIEKPPGTSLKEFLELESIATHYRVPVMVGVNRRHYSIIRKAVDDAGGFKAIHAVFVEWSEDPEHFLKNGHPPERVGRMIFGNSMHGLDMLTYLAGELSHPQVVAKNFGEPFRWMMALQGVSDRGVLASFQSTWDSPGRWRLTFCSRGRRYIFSPLETCIVLEKGSKTERTIEPDEFDKQFKPGFYSQGCQFLEMIKTRQVSNSAGFSHVKPSMELAQLLTNEFILNRKL
jgi:predicted dehydrogenase